MRRICALAAVLLFLGQTVAAQEPSRSLELEVGLLFGGYFPLRDLGSGAPGPGEPSVSVSLENGAAWGAQALLGRDPGNLLFGVQFLSINSKLQGLGSTLDADVTLLSVIVRVQFDPLFARIRPYLGSGLGRLRYSGPAFEQPSVTRTVTTIQFSLGAGAVSELGSRLQLRIELMDYIHEFNFDEATLTPTSFDDRYLHNIAVTVGLSWSTPL